MNKIFLTTMAEIFLKERVYEAIANKKGNQSWGIESKPPAA